MIRVNRALFQELAEQHLEDAKALLEQQRWAGAYHLAGYCIECALKACIAKKTQEYDFPLRNARDAYSHDMAGLLKMAGLIEANAARGKASENFGLNWREVQFWSEESRYDPRGEDDARNLIRAIGDNEEGVLSWIKQHW